LLIFENRVKFISPAVAGRPDEEMKLGIFNQRNQLIGNFCAKIMLYRGLDSGIIWAMNEGAKIEFINNESGNHFTAIIYREEKNKRPKLKRICLKFQRHLFPTCRN